MKCLICSSLIVKPFFRFEERVEKKKKTRTYYKCKECDYVFLDPLERLEKSEEKKRYLKHNNDTKDERYLKFLSSLYDVSFKKEHKSLLDFGCGPTESMKALNSKIESYDPFFPYKEKLKKKYDLILCSEVVEHFYKPFEEFKRLSEMLNQGGSLAIRTQVLDKQKEKDFKNWSYRQDVTHVGFFQKKTFFLLAKRLGLILKEPRESIFIFSLTKKAKE